MSDKVIRSKPFAKSALIRTEFAANLFNTSAWPVVTPLEVAAVRVAVSKVGGMRLFNKWMNVTLRIRITAQLPTADTRPNRLKE